MQKKVNNPVFIFFSDDIEWCKGNFSSIKYELYFESGKDTLAEKISLMSSCKHFIISNSTFSWWAQWLGQNEKKIVISPKHWYKYHKEFMVEYSFEKFLFSERHE